MNRTKEKAAYYWQNDNSFDPLFPWISTMAAQTWSMSKSHLCAGCQHIAVFGPTVIKPSFMLKPRYGMIIWLMFMEAVMLLRVKNLTSHSSVGSWGFVEFPVECTICGTTVSLIFFEAEVTHQRKMVWRVVEGRQPVGPNLFLCRHVQNSLYPERVFSVPNIVQGATTLPCGPDLPRRVFRLRRTVLAEFFIGRVQT